MHPSGFQQVEMADSCQSQQFRRFSESGLKLTNESRKDVEDTNTEMMSHEAQMSSWFEVIITQQTCLSDLLPIILVTVLFSAINLLGCFISNRNYDKTRGNKPKEHGADRYIWLIYCGTGMLARLHRILSVL